MMISISFQILAVLLINGVVAQNYYYYYPARPAPYYYSPQQYYPQYYRQSHPQYQRSPQNYNGGCSQNSMSLGQNLLANLGRTTNQISTTKQHLQNLISEFDNSRMSPFEVPRILLESTHTAIDLSRDLSRLVSSGDIKCMLRTSNGKASFSKALSKLRDDQSELSMLAESLIRHPGSAVGTLVQLFSKLESSVASAVGKMFGMMQDDSSSSSDDDSSSPSQDPTTSTSTGDSFDSFQTSAADDSSSSSTPTDTAQSGGFGDFSDSSSDSSSSSDAAAITPTITSSPPAPSGIVYTFSTNEVFTFTDIQTERIQGRVMQKEFTFVVTDEFYFTNTLNAAAGPINSIMVALAEAQHTSLVQPTLATSSFGQPIAAPTFAPTVQVSKHTVSAQDGYNHATITQYRAYHHPYKPNVGVRALSADSFSTDSTPSNAGDPFGTTTPAPQAQPSRTGSSGRGAISLEQHAQPSQLL